MVLRKFMGIFAVTLLVCGASIATAGIPDLFESEAAAATGGTLSLFCLPNGGGSAFADAYVKDAATVTNADATITLTLRDGGGVAIDNFPREDLWLQWIDESKMHVCSGGTIANANTDAAGVTVWANALVLGGYSETLVQVMVNGDALTSSAGIALSANSADLNFSGKVDLADVGIFAADFIAPVKPYRSDFASGGGALNVADVGKMALGVGAECP
jgi:hypothetical protein